MVIVLANSMLKCGGVWMFAVCTAAHMINECCGARHTVIEEEKIREINYRFRLSSSQIVILIKEEKI